MKFALAFIAVCLVASAFAENSLGFSDEQLQALKNVESWRLPPMMQLRKDASHWCCSNEQPIATESRTKVVMELHQVATKVKTGYTNCGFLGSTRCTIYSTKYKHVAQYHTATYEVPKEDACKDHHVVCCKGFLEIGGNCFDLATIQENSDLILELVNAGIVKPGKY